MGWALRNKVPIPQIVEKGLENRDFHYTTIAELSRAGEARRSEKLALRSGWHNARRQKTARTRLIRTMEKRVIPSIRAAYRR